MDKTFETCSKAVAVGRLHESRRPVEGKIKMAKQRRALVRQTTDQKPTKARGRPKGARDATPRTVNRNSLANLQHGRGRPPGVPNKVSREIKAAARALVEDPDYVASLTARLTAGKAPHMETLLFHYAYGKPRDEIGVAMIGAVRVIHEYASADDDRVR